MLCPRGGCFSIFRRADDVTQTMSGGGGGACECLPPPSSGNPVSAPVFHPSKFRPPPPTWLAGYGPDKVVGQNPRGQNPRGQNPRGQNPRGQYPGGQNPSSKLRGEDKIPEDKIPAVFKRRKRRKKSQKL